MKKIAIIGAGGFGREILMLIENINEIRKQYQFIGFYDDNVAKNSEVDGYKVVGKILELNNVDYPLCVALGIGSPDVKKKIIAKISNENITYPALIHNSVIYNSNLTFGEGTVICAGTIITTNVTIKKFVTLNLKCTVGHDTIIHDFCSFMPAVNISGEVIVGKGVYIGTGASIINQIEIGHNSTIGAGAVITNEIPANCTAVGIPARPIKFHNK